MKNKLLKLSLSVPVALSLFFASGAQASTIPIITFVRSGNGNMFTCPVPNTCLGTASSTAPMDALTVSAGFFNSTTNNNAYATLYNASGTIVLSTSTIANFPAGSYATTSVIFPYPYTLQSGTQYQIGWTAVNSTGDLIDQNNSQIGAQTSASDFSLVLSSPTVDFPRWLYNLTYLATSTDYTLTVQYSRAGLAYTDSLDFNSGSLADQYVYLPKSIALALPFATSTWTATSTLTLTSNGNMVTQHAQSFEVYAQTQDYALLPGWNTVSTSTLALDDVNSSSSPFYVDCSAYENIPFFASGTIGGIFCNAKKTVFSIAQWLLVLPDFARNYWTGTMNSVKQVPPFNVVWGVIEQFQSYAQTTSTTAYSDLTLDIPEAHLNTQILSANMVETWLTTSHCDATCAHERKGTIFTWISAIIWVGAGLKILTFIF